MLQLVVDGIHGGTTAASETQQLCAAVQFSLWNNFNFVQRCLMTETKVSSRLANPKNESWHSAQHPALNLLNPLQSTDPLELSGGYPEAARQKPPGTSCHLRPMH